MATPNSGERCLGRVCGAGKGTRAEALAAYGHDVHSLAETLEMDLPQVMDINLQMQSPIKWHTLAGKLRGTNSGGKQL